MWAKIFRFALPSLLEAVNKFINKHQHNDESQTADHT